MSMRSRSNEVVTCQFKELQATCLSLSRDGRLGLLSGRRHLALLDMEDPQEIVKKVGRKGGWEVGAAGWNPHTQYSDHVALCCNDKLELFTCHNSGDLLQETSVRGHSRMINDIHWSCSEPALLASAGMDGNTHVWDIRENMRRPCHSFNTIVGAGHVRWSRDGQYLATAHEGDVKLWDARGDTSPLSCVSVHMSRVHSIDWSYVHESSLVTASADCSVKYHNVTSARQVVTSSSHASLTTSVAVWTARHTPFGDGLVTVLVPHFGAHDHSLFLWNTNNLSTPVHTFIGHKDVILDFDWRKCGSDYQMVTWARDQTLRMWNIDTDIQYRCGVDEDDLESLDNSDEEVEVEAVEAIYLNFNKKADTDQELEETITKINVQKRDPKIVKIVESPVKEHSPESMLENTLQQEFALLDTNLTFVKIVDRDLERRACRVIANTGHSRLLISISFPLTYPVTIAPVFTFLKGSTLIQQHRTKILRMLQDTALTQVKKNRGCLEICLRQLELMLDQMNQEEIADEEATKNIFPFVRSNDSHNNTINYGLFQDTTVPYPRTSGSRFCSNGLLVCFGRPTFQMQVSHDQPDTSQTPRTYSAYLSNVTGVNTGASDQDLMKFNQLTVTSRYSTIHSSNNIVNNNNIDTVAASNKDQQQNTIKKGRFKVKRVASGAQDEGLLKLRRNITKLPRSRHLNNPPLKVTVYHISSMLPVSRDLAQGYIVTRDPSIMCQHNSSVAQECGHQELGQVWQVVGQVILAAREIGEGGAGGPWSVCPLGQPLISSLINHHIQCRDFQTVALIICALTSQTRIKRRTVSTVESAVELSNNQDKFWFLKTGVMNQSDSPYHTVHSVHSQTSIRTNSGSDTKLDTIILRKSVRSSSWTDLAQDEPEILEDDDDNTDTIIGDIRHGLLDENKTEFYKSILLSYSELLYNWGLHTRRTEVTKHGPLTRFTCVGVTCQSCHERVSKSFCSQCSKHSLRCIICR